jgi:hypothetical protein
MLARYKIYRGQRPRTGPLPVGVRQDTRWRHERANLESFLDGHVRAFVYFRGLPKRFRQSPEAKDLGIIPASNTARSAGGLSDVGCGFPVNVWQEFGVGEGQVPCGP